MLILCQGPSTTSLEYAVTWPLVRSAGLGASFVGQHACQVLFLQLFDGVWIVWESIKVEHSTYRTC